MCALRKRVWCWDSILGNRCSQVKETRACPFSKQPLLLLRRMRVWMHTPVPGVVGQYIHTHTGPFFSAASLVPKPTVASFMRPPPKLLRNSSNTYSAILELYPEAAGMSNGWADQQ